MKKLRNHNKFIRILNKCLDTDAILNVNELLEKEYFNFQFDDWYGSNFSKKGLIRTKIIELLFEIHNTWKIELEKLNQPFYLAIWFYEPNLFNSEVVCAIGSRIVRYENETFTKSSKNQNLQLNNFGKLINYFTTFNWTRNIEYYAHDNSDYNWSKESYENIKDYYRNVRYYKRILPKCKRIEEDKYGKVYYQEIGDIWVGIEK